MEKLFLVAYEVKLPSHHRPRSSLLTGTVVTNGVHPPHLVSDPLDQRHLLLAYNLYNRLQPITGALDTM